jgi:hypothetical protein
LRGRVPAAWEQIAPTVATPWPPWRAAQAGGLATRLCGPVVSGRVSLSAVVLAWDAAGSGAVAIISIAQQARPNIAGQSEELRAQLRTVSTEEISRFCFRS